MPVSTRSRTNKKDVAPSSSSETKNAPSTKLQSNNNRAPTASSSSSVQTDPSMPSVNNDYVTAEVEMENLPPPKRKNIIKLQKKDCALLASILKQPMFDDDEIPNLIMDFEAGIQKRLFSGKSFSDSYRDNPRAAAAQTPLMKKFFSRCPKYRDNMMTTQRPSPIEEETREREIGNGTPSRNGLLLHTGSARRTKKSGKKKKGVSYLIPSKSPFAKPRLTRSKSKAKPTELNFSSSAYASSVNHTETETDEEKQKDSSSTTVKTLSTTKTVLTKTRVEVESKSGENDSNTAVENVIPLSSSSPSSNQTINKKRKPEFSEHESNHNHDIFKVPQTFDFGEEPMKSATKKRILDLPSGLPSKFNPVDILNKLSKKKLNESINSQQESATLAATTTDSTHESSGLVVSSDKMEEDPNSAPLVKPNNTSIKAAQQSSTSSTSNVTLTSKPISEPNATFVVPPSLGVTQNVEIQKPTEAQLQNVTVNIQTSKITPSSTSTVTLTSKPISEPNATFVVSPSLGVTYNAGPSPAANATYHIPPSSRATSGLIQGNETVIVSSHNNNNNNNDTMAGTSEKPQSYDSSSSSKPNTIVQSTQRVSGALLKTPTGKPAEKKRSAQLVRSASSNIDLLQRRRDNAAAASDQVGGLQRTSSSSSLKLVKLGDRAPRSPSATMIDKLSEGQKVAEKLTDLEKIKKLEEKQDKCIRTKEEILQQKKAMHKKKNDEWEAKIERMRAKEEERKKAEEERRKAEEVARKEVEERREAERKKKAEEAAKKEAEMLAKLAKQEESAKVKAPLPTFSVKAAVQAFTLKAKAGIVRPPPPPVKGFLPKHLQFSSTDKGGAASCSDITKKCGPLPTSDLHSSGKVHVPPSFMSKQMSGSASQLDSTTASKDVGASESSTVASGSAWRPQGKNVQATMPPPPPPATFKQPVVAWKMKSPKAKTPVKLSKPVPPKIQPPPKDDSIHDNDTFVSVSPHLNDTIEGQPDTYDITIYDNIDEDMKHRDGKYIPPWADDANKLNLSLFLQQPNLIELMKRKYFPNKNMGFQIFPKSTSRR